MIYAALMLGILGSMHCIGMCGPIALAIPAGKSLNRFLISRFLYNTGRVITYMTLGAILGLAGGVFIWLGWQQWLAMALGALMFIFALFSFRLNYNYKVPTPLQNLLILIKSKIAHMFKKKGFLAPLVTGMLNGLIPCGLVYLAMGTALASGNILDGATFMTFFGIGTIPALLATAFAGRIAGIKLRTGLLKFSPVFIALLAVVIFLRGFFIEVPQTEPGIGFMLQETICGGNIFNPK
ncbi:MAG TPA: sulfite exporter TauE/SafE family protein [Cyclobacteriaceae bacterium]|nr:sulfite exporter TauE/SafE family protein [Cyclobacteriaceae bacterium]